MHDQRISGARGVFCPRHRAPLQAVFGIGHGILIGRLGLGIALQANPDARLVHHGEHRAHTLVQLAQQIAGRAVIVHHTGGIAVDAHLFFNLADRGAVARPERAIGIHQKLRHDEQRDALGAFAAARCLGQHKVDDIFRKVMLACRDEDLLPGDLVAAIGLRFSLGAHQAQIGAAMRLCQVHGAGPVAGHHLGQVGRLLRLGAMRVDRRIGAMRQALIHVECHVGGHEHLAHRGAQHIGHALPAIFRIAV
ncbi:hypothetical protein GALL_445250 [mine drainage metagenome]|uniref:Uncharacterized protein n=1 Tax=mine drainage metagenome TaxID=410659 RepID=A0A1J5PSP2_9ZZZZ